MNTKNHVAVLGGGSFGTVLANIAASNGYEVRLWVRDADQALRINSEGANTVYHPELKLSENISASEDLETIVDGAQYILVATPSLIFEKIVARLEPLIDSSVSIISFAGFFSEFKEGIGYVGIPLPKFKRLIIEELLFELGFSFDSTFCFEPFL